MTMKIILWDVIPCGLMKNYKCFGEIFCFHLQDVELNRVLKRVIWSREARTGSPERTNGTEENTVHSTGHSKALSSREILYLTGSVRGRWK
jgi:hypothetical protein